MPPPKPGAGAGTSVPAVATETPSTRQQSSGSGRSKRHNIKLAVEHRERFCEPYADHLNSLLNALPEITNLEQLHREGRIAQLLRSASAKAPKGFGWIVWMPQHIREKFIARKKAFCPKGTHSEFVEFLLLNMEAKMQEDQMSYSIPLAIPVALQENAVAVQRKDHVAVPEFIFAPPVVVTSPDLIQKPSIFQQRNSPTQYGAAVAAPWLPAAINHHVSPALTDSPLLGSLSSGDKLAKVVSDLWEPEPSVLAAQAFTGFIPSPELMLASPYIPAFSTEEIVPAAMSVDPIYCDTVCNTKDDQASLLSLLSEIYSSSLSGDDGVAEQPSPTPSFAAPAVPPRPSSVKSTCSNSMVDMEATDLDYNAKRNSFNLAGPGNPAGFGFLDADYVAKTRSRSSSGSDSPKTDFSFCNGYASPHRSPTSAYQILTAVEPLCEEPGDMSDTQSEKALKRSIDVLSGLPTLDDYIFAEKTGGMMASPPALDLHSQLQSTLVEPAEIQKRALVTPQLQREMTSIVVSTDVKQVRDSAPTVRAPNMSLSPEISLSKEIMMALTKNDGNGEFGGIRNHKMPLTQQLTNGSGGGDGGGDSYSQGRDRQAPEILARAMPAQELLAALMFDDILAPESMIPPESAPLPLNWITCISPPTSPPTAELAGYSGRGGWRSSGGSPTEELTLAPAVLMSADRKLKGPAFFDVLSGHLQPSNFAVSPTSPPLVPTPSALPGTSLSVAPTSHFGGAVPSGPPPGPRWHERASSLPAASASGGSGGGHNSGVGGKPIGDGRHVGLDPSPSLSPTCVAPLFVHPGTVAIGFEAGSSGGGGGGGGGGGPLRNSALSTSRIRVLGYPYAVPAPAGPRSGMLSRRREAAAATNYTC
ncbi:hypothetical protein HK405_000350 [Cladochytrium tenue]|nr:hypothetical protein HK405_000350 [Cladochytrium tenue]